MTSLAERFAVEAERLEGTRFRLHGRTPDTGLDCAGLVACALKNAGGPRAVLPPYRLHNLSLAPFEAAARSCGFGLAAGKVQRGDLLLVTPGPEQQHLVIALGSNRFVHAHAGLRSVVVQSVLPAWRSLAHWRLAKD